MKCLLQINLLSYLIQKYTKWQMNFINQQNHLHEFTQNKLWANISQKINCSALYWRTASTRLQKHLCSGDSTLVNSVMGNGAIERVHQLLYRVGDGAIKDSIKALCLGSTIQWEKKTNDESGRLRGWRQVRVE